MHVMI